MKIREIVRPPMDIASNNRNVVFDRASVVISRYRKYHLFGENVHKPHKPPMTTFQTDFDVTFGIFTCFDIHFRYAAVEKLQCN